MDDLIPKTLFSFEIPGKPRGKQRPFVTKRGITFTPKETVSYENWVKQCFNMKYQNCKILDVPISIYIQASFEIPKSWPEWKRRLIASGKIMPQKKPDIDNVAKAICDALEGLAYPKDQNIVQMILVKQYALPGQRERVIVDIGAWSDVYPESIKKSELPPDP